MFMKRSTRFRLQQLTAIYLENEYISSGVSRVTSGGRPPRVTPSREVTPEGKKIIGKFTKNNGETRSYG